MSQHRGKKCNDKNAGPWRYRGKTDSSNIYLRWLSAWLTSGWENNVSVHIRRPATSSYWKSNWPAETQSLYTNLTNVRLKIFNSASFNVLFELDRWARVFWVHSFWDSNLVQIGYWLRVRKRKHKCRQKATRSQVVKKPRIPGDPPLESRFVANNHRNVLLPLVEKYGKWRKHRID